MKTVTRLVHEIFSVNLKLKTTGPVLLFTCLFEPLLVDDDDVMMTYVVKTEDISTL